jgi:hypothetical protein
VSVATTGRKNRRSSALAFRLARRARIVVVFRGPAPSCEIAYTLRAQGRLGANRVPASALVRKGLVEAGVYAVRVVAVRGERRQHVGDVVVRLGRLEVSRLERDRHRCSTVAARGVISALPSALGGAPPSSDADDENRPVSRNVKIPESGGVAAAPDIELPPQALPFPDASGPPGALVYVAVGLALLALGGIAASVVRTLRGSGA